MNIIRYDYAFPFRIDPASGQGARASYAAHVDQMIRQILLTSPGERINQPQFGCGLRQLLFAPISDALVAATKLQITTALNQWLSDQISVSNVSVTQPGDIDSELSIRIDYTLLETQTSVQTTLQVLQGGTNGPA